MPASTLKRLGERVHLHPPPPHAPCGFSKYVSSKERVKACFLVTFDITTHTFPENFIEIPQVVENIKVFLCQNSL